MLVGGVIDHEIHDDADAALVSFARHSVEIVQGAVHAVNVFVIGNVVAEIYLRRGITRSDPDRIHAQRFQIVQPGGYARKVPDAVVVAVSEAARIYLVENGMLPPGMLFTRARPLGVGTA